MNMFITLISVVSCFTITLERPLTKSDSIYEEHHDTKILDSDKITKLNDMTQPLNQYYVATSHNTYLTGNQISHPSSTRGYINALKKGARCIEIDVWNGPNGKPIVYHGHTKTTRISFDAVIDTILKYSFSYSNYPLVLSLEVHANKEQQREMSKSMKEKFGDKLFLSNMETEKQMLSPEELKNKILIKWVGWSHSLENKEIKHKGVTKHKSWKSKLKSLFRQKTEYSKELASMVVLNITKLESFEEHHLKQRLKNSITNIGETVANTFSKKNLMQFIRHTTHVFCRIYPAWFRIHSSNFNPAKYFGTGCQMNAMNYQTFDVGMQINDALFKQNGGTGYVLKPKLILSDDDKSSKLQVSVISGNLPMFGNLGESYDVKISLFTPSCIKNNQKIESNQEHYHSHTVKPDHSHQNALTIWHPCFRSMENKKCNLFPDETNLNSRKQFTKYFNTEILVPEISFLRFQLRRKKWYLFKTVEASYTIPISLVKTGYSHIPLHDNNGKLLTDASLFVYVNLI